MAHLKYSGIPTSCTCSFCSLVCLSAAQQKYRPVQLQHFLANLIECLFKIGILLTPAMAAFMLDVSQ